MKEEQPNSRRNFLKNVSLASLSVAALPIGVRAVSGLNPEDELQTVACDKTTLDLYGQGPFYTANPPQISNNVLAAANEPGTRIIISGRVMNLDCTEAIANAEIDIWHANDAGQYDNSGYNLRGKINANAQGFYSFETIWPGKYLNGSQYRPAHIHFKISAAGFTTLTTQLYFQGDTSIPADAAASVTSGTYDARARIIPLTQNTNGKYEGTWDVVIDADGVPLSMESLHLDKGIIYSASPNPFWGEVEINYGVFSAAKVSLIVYDMNGKEVANLKELQQTPEKYSAIWNPPANLPAGTYFLALKVNDMQVHYLKVTKTSTY